MPRALSKPRRLPVVLLAVIVLASLAVPTIAGANSALRGIMHTWKRDLRTTDAMLSGRSGFDAGAIRAILTTYAQDAGRVAGQINGQSHSAHDIRTRFQTMQADAQTALQHIDQRSALRGDFSRIAATCQSCHDVYN